MKYLKFLGVSLLGIVTLIACSREVSDVTGWDYNNPKNGGFQKVPFIDQETGPGLVLVEGGTFTMGRSEQDVMFDWNNVPRRVTVSSFYMDQFEVTNFNWLEYLYWVNRTFPDYPMVYKEALPDTNCWRSRLGFNEKYVTYYLRHPAYRDYPVVGVSWIQASNFCKWRSDRVNEYVLIREGIMNMNPNQQGNPFTKEAYMAGQYEAGVKENLTDLDPAHAVSKGKKRKKLGTRIVRMEDGIFLPDYRLPTEAEWEFAYYGLIGNLKEGSEVISDRRLYPWDGHWVRNDNEQFQGDIRANFVRGRGDYMGVAGHLNDNAAVTAPVYSYWPNDYGLYNMAGNVSEWVLDVYRPMSSSDFDEFRPFRGNVFKTKVLNNQGVVEQKNTQVMYDVLGIKEYLNEFERVRYQRITATNYDPVDTVIAPYMSSQVKARNKKGDDGYAPDPLYISHDKVKDSIELALLAQINDVVDRAIEMYNNKYNIEASALIQDEIFYGVFETNFRQGPFEEYSFEIIPMLRQGMSEFVINTPGRLKWRDVAAEENIGRRNYRRADYIDYEDGDIESSIYYDNEKRKNGINQGTLDPDLVMYQNKYERYKLNGAEYKPDDRTSWPTTLVSDESRVYKGGSWKDRAYWLVGSNRRFLDQDMSTSTIGFRCAMDRVGSPTGLITKKQKGRNKNR